MDLVYKRKNLWSPYCHSVCSFILYHHSEAENKALEAPKTRNATTTKAITSSMTGGDNYKVWKERILLHLGCMDIDYAIRKDKPTITMTSTSEEKALRLSVMFIKTKISVGIRGSVDKHDDVKALLMNSL
ncbi:Uncharacterized protein Adt_18987 [Abeliophyllum distichum]|uniref:Gag-pol polyprotein n=1 Tax=Abeliophyllum distichum TaxID=126358 RepID=A0ABD1TKX0_9LAMI